jgi:hypothetical protein
MMGTATTISSQHIGHRYTLIFLDSMCLCDSCIGQYGYPKLPGQSVQRPSRSGADAAH